MLALAHDVNALRVLARERARHVAHHERDARTERNADADKNSRRGFFVVPRYLDIGQRLLNERRRQENPDVRGETASDSPHQNKGGVGPRTGLSQDAGTPETSGTMGRGGGSSAMPKADLSREAEFLALTLIPAARAAQLIATGIRLARAAQIARALSISAKAARGAKAEAYVAKLFEGAGVELVGKQVSVRTAAGLRRIDLLVRDKAGQLFAIEVKSGTATRNAVQLAKDRLFASEGGRLVGANAGRLSGEHHVINTIEFLVP